MDHTNEDEQVYEFYPTDINFDNVVFDFNDTKLNKNKSRDSNSPGEKYQKCPPFSFQEPLDERLRLQPSCSKMESITPVEQFNSDNIGSPVETSSTPKSFKIIQNDNKKRPHNLQANRRRPMSGVKILTSSDVGEKYNILLGRRLVIVEKNIEQAVELQNLSREQHKQSLKNLKLQEENLSLVKQEKLLKIELLKLELKCKKTLLSSDP